MGSSKKKPLHYCEVAVPGPFRHLFTYKIPAHLQQTALPGKRVVVPFGRRKIIALLIRRLEKSEVKTKDIESIIDEEPMLDSSLINLIVWGAHYYLCNFADLCFMALPKGDVKMVKIIQIRDKNMHIPEGDKNVQQFFDILKNRGNRNVDLLRQDLDMPSADFAKFLKRKKIAGEVRVTEQARKVVARQILHKTQNAEKPKEIELSKAQNKIAEKIFSAINEAVFRPILLKGVTGSGKTEIYVKAVKKVLDSGKSVLVLAPEIALADILAKRLGERSGVRAIVIHSDMPAKSRNLAIEAVKKEGAKLVVGARSAIFAPIADLGLIIVDEEHDPSYKQDNSPRYSGRDLAVKRAELLCLSVVLGSATPSMESFYNAKAGRYQLLELNERIDGKPLPKVKIVPPQRAGEIGMELEQEIGKRLKKGEQSLIFINRRGALRYLQCARCGKVVECRNCSVSLVYHQSSKKMVCHTCDYSQKVPEDCPECAGVDFVEGGLGSQRVESDLVRLFPAARIVRIDRDSTKKRGAASAMLRDIGKGDVDILVGTQMITKGHDFAGITLVGITGGDDSLFIPDFRAGERTFQIITQTAGRAGRGDTPGLVIVQSRSPEHHSLACAVDHDYDRFYETEILIREMAGYPPFVRMAIIRIDSANEKRGEKFCELAGEWIKDLRADYDGIDIQGPAESVIYKIRNRYNFRIMLRCKNSGARNQVVAKILSQFDTAENRLTSGINMIVDIDPVATL